MLISIQAVLAIEHFSTCISVLFVGKWRWGWGRWYYFNLFSAFVCSLWKRYKLQNVRPITYFTSERQGVTERGVGERRNKEGRGGGRVEKERKWKVREERSFVATF